MSTGRANRQSAQSAFRWLGALLPVFCQLPLAFVCDAATFTNQTRIDARDPDGNLTLHTANSANTFSVSFWFRPAIPSGYTLGEHMTLVMSRRDGNENQPYGCWFRLNYTNANLEYLARDAGGNLVPVKNLAQSKQVVFDAGRKRILPPRVNVTDMPTISGEQFAKFQNSFCADPADAVFKGMGVH